MNNTVVYSKTGKGLLEIKNRANRLSKDQYRVLNLVDGKSTLLDLAERAKVSEVEARKILTGLGDAGYIKEVTNQNFDLDVVNVPPIASYVDDMDLGSIAATQQLKPSFYQSAFTEQRQREESERKASEAAASKARAEAERRAREEAQLRLAEEQAAHKVREEAERRARAAQEREERLALELRERAEAERKAKEEAARRAQAEQEAVERRAREEVERRARIQAEARARVEAEKRAREEEERKRREEAERRREEEEARRQREEAERKEEEERRQREEAERKRKEEEERRRREEAERKRKEEEERKRREEEERKRKEEEERKRREEAERKRKEEEERKRREEEERKRKEEEERKRREEEERKRKEEEERKRREEEERKRKEEEGRRRREEEERKRKEEEERRRREEEERKRKEEEERRRREEEERKRKEEEERRRREEEERKRKEEEERRRREEEERLRRELEAKHRQEQEELARQLEQSRQRAELASAPSESGAEHASTPVESGVPRESAQYASGAGDVIDVVGAEVELLGVDVEELPEVSVSDRDIEALALAEAQVEQEFVAREEAIRKALEEQERRFRMEEEARAAMDRAEREARERTDRDAREMALAAERARKEAEQRAREEAARRAEQERENRAREKAERKKQAEEQRKKRERDRHLAEQRSREEELTRRRKEQDEADLRKSEIDRLQREARKRAFGPGKKVGVAVLGVVVLLIAAIQFTPFTAYAPAVEKIASDTLGERVSIGKMRASLFPGLHFELEGVGVGDAEDIKAGKVIAFISVGSLFSIDKSVSRLVIENVVLPQDALVRLPRLLSPQGKSSNVQIERVEFKRAQIQIPGIELPTFDAALTLTPMRTVAAARVETNDAHFSADLVPTGQGVEVSGRGMNFTLPFGPRLEIAQFTGRGLISGGQLRVPDLEYSVYGGQGRGELTVSWAGPWTVEGSFDMQRVELEAAMKALGVELTSDGALAAKGQYAMQSVDLPALFSDNPRLQASFVITQGNLSGLDLVRALQSPAREGIQGGKTTFEEIAGNLALADGRYQYSGVRIKAGAMNATGQLEIAPSQSVTGRAYVELRSTAGAIRSNFRIAGSTQAMLLRP
ncbi:MAG: hypothetical protein IT532_06850 [Burkholderiales bacterium]|nr:hypothetical protein [Burkholderiales bacterium]